jgi:hypothetical protein
MTREVEDRRAVGDTPRATDYELGNRSRAAIAVQIDHTFDRLLRKNADREELWPLLYEYAAAGDPPDPDIGIQAFVNGDTWEATEGQYRWVRFEDCPTPVDERCQSEYHHWGRGCHMVPLDPDWVPS